jgi:tetratricopeptide (TPR) repeat protein
MKILIISFCFLFCTVEHVYTQSSNKEKIAKYLFLAEKQLQKNNDSKAYSFIDQAIELKPDSCELQLVKSDFYFKFQQVDLAIQNSERLLKSFPKCFELYKQLIEFYEFSSMDDKVFKLIDEGLNQFIDSEMVKYFLTKKTTQLIHAERYHEVIDLLKSFDVNQDVWLKAYLGLSLYHTGDKTKGINLIESTFGTNDTTNADLIFELAPYLIEEKKYSLVEKHIEASLKLSDNTFFQSKLFYLLGSSFRAQKLFDKAEPCFRMSINLYEYNFEANRDLALTLIENKKNQLACYYFKQAVKTAKDSEQRIEIKALIQQYCNQ